MNSNAQLILRTNGDQFCLKSRFFWGGTRSPHTGMFSKRTFCKGRDWGHRACSGSCSYEDTVPTPTSSLTPLPFWCHQLGAHRSVWLNEAVLQLLGILPLPCEAESLQLAHLRPQDIGQGTHAPNSSCPRVRCRTSVRASSHREFQTLVPSPLYSGEMGYDFYITGWPCQRQA